VIRCGPAKVAVENGVAAGRFLVAPRYCVLVVEVVVAATAVPTLRHLVASHAYVGGVSELETVLTDRVLVIRVHAFGLAGPVVDTPGGLFRWDSTRNGESQFCFEGGHNCYEAAFRLAVFFVFPVPEELDACRGGCCVGGHLSAQVL